MLKVVKPTVAACAVSVALAVCVGSASYAAPPVNGKDQTQGGKKPAKPPATKPKPPATKPKPAATKPKPPATKPKPAATKPKPRLPKDDDIYDDVVVPPLPKDDDIYDDVVVPPPKTDNPPPLPPKKGRNNKGRGIPLPIDDVVMPPPLPPRKPPPLPPKKARNNKGRGIPLPIDDDVVMPPPLPPRKEPTIQGAEGRVRSVDAFLVEETLMKMSLTPDRNKSGQYYIDMIKDVMMNKGNYTPEAMNQKAFQIWLSERVKYIAKNGTPPQKQLADSEIRNAEGDYNSKYLNADLLFGPRNFSGNGSDPYKKYLEEISNLQELKTHQDFYTYSEGIGPDLPADLKKEQLITNNAPMVVDHSPSGFNDVLFDARYNADWKNFEKSGGKMTFIHIEDNLDTSTRQIPFPRSVAHYFARPTEEQPRFGQGFFPRGLVLEGKYTTKLKGEEANRNLNPLLNEIGQEIPKLPGRPIGLENTNFIAHDRSIYPDKMVFEVISIYQEKFVRIVNLRPKNSIQAHDQVRVVRFRGNHKVDKLASPKNEQGRILSRSEMRNLKVILNDDDSQLIRSPQRTVTCR